MHITPTRTTFHAAIIHANNVSRRNHPCTLQAKRHVIVAGDMNDYDGRVLDSFGHKPTSTALRLMAEAGGEANALVSAGQHVASADRFTDWYRCLCRFVRHFCADCAQVRYQRRLRG
jgi:hypothetical protein